MIHSLQLIGSRGPGGAERFFCRLVNALHSDKQEVIAISPGNSAVAGELGRSVSQYHLPFRSVLDLYTRWRISALVGKLQPVIVQTWLGRATRLTHLPAGQCPIHIARLGGYYRPHAYRHAHAWVGNTRGICDYLVRQGFPPARVFHIGNFVPLAARISTRERHSLRRALGLDTDAFVIIAAGRIHEVKGFVDLVNAFTRLPDEIGGRPKHLLIVGDGPARGNLETAIRHAGMEERITLTGWLSDPADCYDLSDLFISPSRQEPLGNVILEAWSHQLPVIATRTAGALELVDPGRNGLLVPCQSESDLATAIQALATDAAAREEMVKSGRDTVGRYYSESVIVSAYREMYDRLAGR